MKKICALALSLACCCVGNVQADVIGNITYQIPEIANSTDLEGYQKIEDVAQYKEAVWSNVIGIAHHVSRSEAKKIADNNPEITYFFYTKGYLMILEKQDGTYRYFQMGDAVFFSDEPWWGSAPDLADGYIKVSSKASD